MVIQLPKTQWPFDQPEVFHYELTAHTSELSNSVLAELMDYSALARTAPKAAFDRHPPLFGWGGNHGHYGWTRKGWEYANQKKV